MTLMSNGHNVDQIKFRTDCICRIYKMSISLQNVIYLCPSNYTQNAGQCIEHALLPNSITLEVQFWGVYCRYWWLRPGTIFQRRRSIIITRYHNRILIQYSIALLSPLGMHHIGVIGINWLHISWSALWKTKLFQTVHYSSALWLTQHCIFLLDFGAHSGRFGVHPERFGVHHSPARVQQLPAISISELLFKCCVVPRMSLVRRFGDCSIYNLFYIMAINTALYLSFALGQV